MKENFFILIPFFVVVLLPFEGKNRPSCFLLKSLLSFVPSLLPLLDTNVCVRHTRARKHL